MVKDYIINLKSLVHQLMQISSSLQVEGISSWEVVMYKLSFPQGGNDQPWFVLLIFIMPRPMRLLVGWKTQISSRRRALNLSNMRVNTAWFILFSQDNVK